MAFCFLANALLARETWARERLAPFAGQGFQLHLPLAAPFTLVVAPGGRLEPGDAPAAAIVTPGGITGDSALADELRYLRRHLRPDVEEELSRFVGDIAAHRIVSTARALDGWARDAVTRTAQGAAEYWTEESPLLASRVKVEGFVRDVNALREAVDRIEQRIERLERAGT